MRTGIVDRNVVAATRATTNKVKMPMYVNWTGVPEPDLFQLSNQGHTLVDLTADDGSDIEEATPPPDDPARTIDSFISDLFRQFIIDLNCKSPNPRGGTNPSYIKLTTVQRREANEDIYKNSVLSDVFRAVAYKNGTTEDWERAFKWLFPEPGFRTTSSVQNYPSCPYYPRWLEFIDNPRNSPVLITDTRKAIWKRIRTWAWIPHAQQDKIWPTKGLAAFTRWPEAFDQKGNPKAAPRILIRRSMVPTFVVADNDMDVESDGA